MLELRSGVEVSGRVATPPVLSSHTTHTATRTPSFGKCIAAAPQGRILQLNKLLKTEATVNAAATGSAARMARPHRTQPCISSKGVLVPGTDSSHQPLNCVQQQRRVGFADTQTSMLPRELGSAMCVQNLDDSRGLAVRITYRISLRSSSLWEPRHPLLKVVFSCNTTVFVCYGPHHTPCSWP